MLEWLCYGSLNAFDLLLLFVMFYFTTLLLSYAAMYKSQYNQLNCTKLPNQLLYHMMHN